MAASVLDASALLALLKDEAGGDVVHEHLLGAVISSVNAIEVVTKRIDDGGSPAEAVTEMRGIPITIVPLDEDLALRAGALRAATRGQGLSLGDRACLALAEREGLPALTADRAWAALDLGVEVVLIR